MIEIEDALEDCLAQLAKGANLNECLARYPQYTAELGRLLAAAQQVQMGQTHRPAPGFKTRTRARVFAYARAHPRRQPFWWAGLFSANLRVALSMAGIALALVTLGTGAAQAALPGDTLYNWKLASEQTWRAVTPDHLSIDLALSERRATELEQVAGQPQREGLARAQYQRSLNVLLTYTGAEARQAIRLELVNQQQSLEQAKLYVTALDQILLALETPPVTATSTLPISTTVAVTVRVTATMTATARVTEISTSTPRPNTPQATAVNTQSLPTALPNLVATLVPTLLPSSLPSLTPIDLPLATLVPTSLPALPTDLPPIVATLVPDLPQVQVTLPVSLPTP
jgi:hypothetical protein